MKIGGTYVGMGGHTAYMASLGTKSTPTDYTWLQFFSTSRGRVCLQTQLGEVF